MKRLNRCASRARPRSRRGVAILLVLVALGTATVLSASYLSSRQSAPAVGLNAEVSSNAGWAASSATNMGLAILQTSYSLAGDIESDQIVSGVPFGLGDADALVTNSRGDAANTGEARLILSAIGSSDRVGTLKQRVVLRRPTDHVTRAMDPYMREFAVLAVERLRFQNSSYIAPWPGSDRGPTQFVANIGVAFAPSGMLSTSGAGSLHSTRLIVDANATSSLRTVSQSTIFGGGLDAGVRFPTASARVPQALTDLGTGGPMVFTWNSGTTYTASRPDYANITVTAGCTFIFDESVSPIYSVSDLVVTSGSTIRISGDVQILVRDDLDVLNRSNIELADSNSSVRFYVIDDFTVDNSVVGLSRALALDTSRSYENLTGAFAAADIRVFMIDPAGGGDASQIVSIDDRSILIADIHAPASQVAMANASVIIGRLTGRDIDLRNASIVFYDHTLNPGAGLSDPRGPIYDSDRFDTLRDALASFDNTKGIEALTQHIVDEFSKAGVDPDPAEPGPISANAPDPRDSAKVLVVPMRRGSARAIEAGEATGSFDSLIPIRVDSVLAQALGGINGALRATLPGGGGGGDDDDEGGGGGGGGLLGGILGGLLGGN